MVRVINPVGTVASLDKALATRPGTIEGMTVALLDNNKPGATPLLHGIAEALKKEGVAESLYRRKSHPAGPSPYVADLAGRVQLAISAVGD